MLRSKRWEDAEALSQRLQEDYYESIPPVLYHLQKGNVDKAVVSLEALKADELLNELEAWPDMVSPLWNDSRYSQFAEFFRLRSLPWPVIQNEFDLFFGAGQAPTVDFVREQVAIHLGDQVRLAELSLENFDDAIVDYAVETEVDGIRVMMVLAKSDASDNFRRSDNPIPEIADHTHCLAIAVINPFEQFQPGAQRLVTELAAAINGDGCVGAYCTWDSVFHVDPAQDLPRRLAGTQTGVSRSTAFTPQEAEPDWRQRRDLFRKLHDLDTKPGNTDTTLRVQVAFDLGRGARVAVVARSRFLGRG